MRLITTLILAAPLFLAVIAPAAAQRIELDGRNANGVEIGRGTVEIERSIGGNLSVGTDDDGIEVDADVSTSLDVNDSSETIGSGISLDTGGDSIDSAPASTPGAPATVDQTGVSAEPSTTQPVSPMSQMRLPSEPFQASDCIDADVFAEHRDDFLKTDVPDASVYIRRVDVTVCGYEPSRELMTYLNTMPEIRDGLAQMLIDPEQIVSADWTDDAGLLIYTIDPASIP